MYLRYTWSSSRVFTAMDSNENTSLVKTNGGGDQPYGADDVNIDMKGVEAEDEVKLLY